MSDEPPPFEVPPAPADGTRLDNLLTEIERQTDAPQTSGAIKDKVHKTLANKVVEARAELLVQAIEKYQFIQRRIAQLTRPDGGYYTLPEGDGEFVWHPTFSKALVDDEIKPKQDALHALREAIEPCLNVQADGPKPEVFDNLAAVMKAV